LGRFDDYFGGQQKDVTHPTKYLKICASVLIGRFGGSLGQTVITGANVESFLHQGWYGTYTWSSSDGQIVAGRTAKLFYDQPGIYKITLTVRNNRGYSDSTIVSVNVLPSAVTHYTAEDLKEEFDKGYQKGQDSCLENPEFCGITIASLDGFTQEQLDEAKNEVIQNCKNNPISCGIVNTLTPEVIKLINISTRAPILGDTDNVIAGFVISGTGTQRVVLGGWGLEEGVDPKLTLRKYPSSELIAENDDWQDNPRYVEIPEQMATRFQKIDAGLVLDLPNGAYTVTLSSMGKKGIGLVGVNAID